MARFMNKLRYGSKHLLEPEKLEVMHLGQDATENEPMGSKRRILVMNTLAQNLNACQCHDQNCTF